MRYLSGEPQITSAADVSRNFGLWQDRAINGPIVVTHHGRPRVVIISADQFATWKEKPAEVGSGGEPARFEFETRLATVLDHTEDAFISVDSQLRITAVNIVSERYFWMMRDKLVGNILEECIPALKDSIFTDRIRRTLRTGLADIFESQAVVFPERRVKVRVFPYASGVGVLFSNITEEALRMRELAASHAFRNALVAVGGAYATVNMRGAVVEASQSFCELLGLGMETVQGVRFTDLLALSDRVHVQREIEEVFQSAKPRGHAARMLVRGGTEFDVRLGFAPVVTGATPEAVVCVVTPLATEMLLQRQIAGA